ncbi:hypothetical protein AQUCO_04200166v1 [Aquilegia coerulea]|uniref:Uncharacterized protein n=1 Tax=Aquilegia coerulea TaxID=218851 RepID=A0A2G5CPK9_AQUCA|nr:hypothetical protein AQUCO_04200166v1 [Aquilegia coerulea]
MMLLQMVLVLWILFSHKELLIFLIESWLACSSRNLEISRKKVTEAMQAQPIVHGNLSALMSQSFSS